MESFAKRITNRRIQLGLTQKQVADALGVPISTYKEWEYGRRIQGEGIYVRLSEVLEMNLRVLLTGEITSSDEAREQRIQHAISELSEIKKMLLSCL